MMNEDLTQLNHLPFVVVYEDGSESQTKQDGTQKEFQVGDLCPACQKGHLDYNGLLNLECDQCRYTLGGCFT